MDAVAGLGCLACRLEGVYGVPAQLHHPREGKGLAERGSDLDVIGLCPAHHTGQGKSRNFISIHMRPKEFAEKYGSDSELVAFARRLIIEP